MIPILAGYNLSPFVINGQAFFYVNPLCGLVGIISPPWFLKLIGFKTIFSPSAFHWFINLTQAIVRRKLQTGLKRNDFVQLLMDTSVDETALGDTNYDGLSADIDKGI